VKSERSPLDNFVWGALVCLIFVFILGFRNNVVTLRAENEKVRKHKYTNYDNEIKNSNLV